jgi:NCS1 family nucleobase:cation symporter-1
VADVHEASVPIEKSPAIERRSIHFVPLATRHGKAHDLFTLWFASNAQVTGVVTGALAVIFGLSLPWALLAVLIGNVVGTVFMALHSAQGPKLGIPQMIQSRAQFGYYGAIIPLVLVILMYVGFFSTGNILGAEALTNMTGMGLSPAIVIVGAACLVLGIVGYRLIHASAKWISLFVALGFVYLTVQLLLNHSLGSVWHASGFHAGTFVLGITVVATYEITFAPYVADYSRYLPQETSIKSCFWYTYAGSVIGNLWMNVFGCIAAAVAIKSFDSTSIGFVVKQASAAHWLFDLIIIFGIVIIGVLNLYSAFMSSVTTLSAIWKRHRIQVRTRALYMIFWAAVGTALAVAGRGSFLTKYFDFILFLSYFIVPWTAVNLMDFYVIRKQVYNITAVFDPDGVYGKWRWQALVAYLVSVGAEIPFMNTTFYKGPVVNMLGGADISWIIGVIVGGLLYLALVRFSPLPEALSVSPVLETAGEVDTVHV